MFLDGSHIDTSIACDDLLNGVCGVFLRGACKGAVSTYRDCMPAFYVPYHAEQQACLKDYHTTVENALQFQSAQSIITLFHEGCF